MIMHQAEQGIATTLRSAAPYLRMHRGHTFVVKAGGALASAAATRALLEQLAVLCYCGVRVVLVHGGTPQLTRPVGPEGTAPAEACDLSVPGVPGGHVADVTAMVLNRVISRRILALGRELEVAAVGISALDARVFGAPVFDPHQPRRHAYSEPPDAGRAPDTGAADEHQLRALLEAHTMVVLSPQVADARGTLHRVDADALAAAVASALGADRLVLCTEAPGVLADSADPTSLISYADLAGLQELRKEGQWQASQRARLDAIEDALRGGVSRVHVVCQDRPDAILGEVFSNEGSGTLFVADATRPAQRRAAPAPSREPAVPASAPAAVTEPTTVRAVPATAR